jgi:cell division protein FtsZ
VQQEEFAFNEGEPRGEFEDTMGYIFEGQDLDTPTYLRRGVKVPV